MHTGEQTDVELHASVQIFAKLCTFLCTQSFRQSLLKNIRTQNIDGGNSLDRAFSSVPKFARSTRIPLKRNDRMR